MGQLYSQMPVSGVGVYLLSENRLLRTLLARLLLKKSGICIVGVSGSPKLAIDEFATARCEILLTDCLASPLHPELLPCILERHPHLKVVLFGMDEDPDPFLRAISLGVSGYVLKD